MDQPSTETPRRLWVDRAENGKTRWPMRRLLIVWLSVALLAFALASWWGFNRVESNVIDDATAQLEAAGFEQQLANDELRIDADYRTVSVTGALPADADAAALEAMLLELDSVTDVEFDVETATPTTAPPTTAPPTTVPPTTAPPATVPPTSVPPTTAPPVTAPPTTDPPAADRLVILYANGIAAATGPIGDLDFAQTVLSTIGTNVDTVNFTGLVVVADAPPPDDPDRLNALLLALPSVDSARITFDGVTLTVVASTDSPLTQAQWQVLAEQAGADEIDITLNDHTPASDGG